MLLGRKDNVKSPILWDKILSTKSCKVAKEKGKLGDIKRTLSILPPQF